MWISRDKDGTLMLSIAKPKKVKNWWEDRSKYDVMDFPEEFLPEGVNPQWEDSEPTEVELKVKN